MGYVTILDQAPDESMVFPFDFKNEQIIAGNTQTWQNAKRKRQNLGIAAPGAANSEGFSEPTVSEGSWLFYVVCVALEVQEANPWWDILESGDGNDFHSKGKKLVRYLTPAHWPKALILS